MANPAALFRCIGLLLALTLGLAGCREEASEAVPEMEPTEATSPPFSRTLTQAGFSTPESALHDTVSDLYLVANIHGGPVDRDGNGFISRISPAGEVLEARWIDGTRPGITLHAPKGMALVADTLYVADIDCLRRFHRVTGAAFPELCLDEATFLNDVDATPRGDVYFTDSGSEGSPGAVYLLRHSADVPQKVTLADGTVLEGADLGGPNGILADRRGLFVATYGSGELFRVTPEGERLQLLPPSEMGLDGIVSLEERGFLFSSWGDSAVYWIRADGTVSPLLEGLEAPADLGYDARRDRVLVPLFFRDALLIREVR